MVDGDATAYANRKEIFLMGPYFLDDYNQIAEILTNDYYGVCIRIVPTGELCVSLI